MDHADGRRLASPWERRTLRFGSYAWALLGLGLFSIFLIWLLGRFTIVILPLLLALFPAAVLAPPVEWLKRIGLPPAVAALIGTVAGLALLAGVLWVVTIQIIDQLPTLVDNLQESYNQIQRFLRRGPLGLPPLNVEDLVGQTGMTDAEAAGGAAMQAVRTFLRYATMAVLLIVVMFFYLKDGRRIFGWIRGLFPGEAHEDVEMVGSEMWATVAAYIRGSVVIALVDAVFIGVGIALIGVPLVIPLATIVFITAFIPVVGAFLSGLLAILVALAAEGVTAALLTLLVVVVVQQLEGNILAPVILGHTTELHPLAVLVVIPIGAVVLGPIGMIIAVPVTASILRGAAYLRQEALA